MNPELSRRALLQASAAGVAVLTMPRFLAGCRPAADVAAPAGLAWFDLDEALLARVMSELSARGADAAELYFEHSRTDYVDLEDGLISRAQSSVDLGVGLRVVIGDQVGFAFTEDLTLEAMLAAARTASAIASGAAAAPPEAW